VAIPTIMAISDLIINFKIGHATPNAISNATPKTSIAKLYGEYGKVGTLLVSDSAK
jgi:hypothetical protein